MEEILQNTQLEKTQVVLYVGRASSILVEAYHEKNKFRVQVLIKTQVLIVQAKVCFYGFGHRFDFVCECSFILSRDSICKVYANA